MPAPHHSVFYRLDALPAANQQHQSTEGEFVAYKRQQLPNIADVIPFFLHSLICCGVS